MKNLDKHVHLPFPYCTESERQYQLPCRHDDRSSRPEDFERYPEKSKSSLSPFATKNCAIAPHTTFQYPLGDEPREVPENGTPVPLQDACCQGLEQLCGKCGGNALPCQCCLSNFAGAWEQACSQQAVSACDGQNDMERGLLLDYMDSLIYVPVRCAICGGNTYPCPNCSTGPASGQRWDKATQTPTTIISTSNFPLSVAARDRPASIVSHKCKLGTKLAPFQLLVDTDLLGSMMNKITVRICNPFSYLNVC